MTPDGISKVARSLQPCVQVEVKRSRSLPDRLRAARANMLGTDDEDLYLACHDAADEIDKLRELLGRVVICCENLDHRKGEYHTGTACPVMEKFADTIAAIQ